MARTYSEMVPLGTEAPPFDLPAANPEVDDRRGATRSLDDYADSEAVVVVFMCNHCPYVIAVEDRLIAVARDYAGRGVQLIGICSNDAERYPDDSFEAMAGRARLKGYPFPYLHDESQEVARAYDAACTPDLYVFDRERRLAYRGRLDDGRPGQEPTTTDLRDALDELLQNGSVSGEQLPSMGCNIKWKEAA
jgi:thiol-disulfide isomerase/thioredoxin